MPNRPGMAGSSLADLAHHLLTHGPRKTNPTSRRVRVIYNRSYVVDTTSAVHVWEHDGYPQFYVPTSELKCAWRDKEALERNGQLAAAVVELSVHEATSDRVLRFAGPSAGVLDGLVRLEFSSMDQWLEEDVPIYVHPRDPFKRVETLASSRHIEIRVAGRSVAKAASAVHLLETGLPTRYYLPLSAVDQGVLRHSSLVTRCPYKGDAQYYHVVVEGTEWKDLVWYYRLPTHESAAIAGLLCFYNERVEILLDGKRVGS